MIWPFTSPLHPVSLLSGNEIDTRATKGVLSAPQRMTSANNAYIVEVQSVKG